MTFSLARQLLSQIVGPNPWPAPWLAVAHNNDYAGGGSFDNYLHAFTSTDGLTWTALAANTQAASIFPATSYRDPSLLWRNGKYWIVPTSNTTYFAVLSSGVFDSGWTHVVDVSTNGVSPTETWAPQWFVDVDDTVHVLVSLKTSGTFKIYELHPTNEDMTAWSTPVLLTGTGFNTNTIDPNLTYWAGTYYLIWKDDDIGEMFVSTSSSPFTGYSWLSTSTGPTVWHPVAGSIEGPQIVDIGTGWRLYFSQNTGFEANDIYYSETTDRTMDTGWTARTAIASFAGYNHPLPIKRA